jgi:hypothetical protein
VVAEVGAGGLGGAVDIVVGGDDAEGASELGEVVVEAVSVGPPAELVVGGAGVSVLERDAGLADAAQAGDRLDQRGGATAREAGVDEGELLLAAGDLMRGGGDVVDGAAKLAERRLGDRGLVREVAVEVVVLGGQMTPRRAGDLEGGCRWGRRPRKGWG